LKEAFATIGRKIELPVSVHLGILGGLLLLHGLGVITIEPSYLQGIIVWVALNLLSSPFALRSRFVTPRIKNPKCHYCGSYMTATKLKCEKCGATSETGK